MPDTAYDRILKALQEYGSKVIPGPGGRRTSEAQCPHHDDRNASLSITALNDRALIWCHTGGCDTRDIMADLGLTMADLYDERSATYRYDDGRTVHRYYDQAGKKQFRQDGATPTATLYHREKLAGLPPGKTVFLVEGEADVHAIEYAGGVATTAPQGAASFHKVDVTPLSGHWVTVIVDKDPAGDTWAQQVDAKLTGVTAKHRFRIAATGKDASDHLAAGHDLTEFQPYTPPGTPDRPQYGDVAAFLAGDFPEPPAPDVLHRRDGIGLLYAGKVNVIYGDAESGKTWIALAALGEILHAGGRVAFVDLDHNGLPEIVTRLLLLGAKPADLGDLGRFRYCEPGDATDLDFFVGDLAAWRPGAVAVDSLGEVLPLLGLSSNSPDDYTTGNRRVLTPLATAGAAVITVDHLPKDDGARQKGQTGTLAKQRTVNGVTLRVTVKDSFAPGQGGTAHLAVQKDRPGGLRAVCPPGRHPSAGTFRLVDDGDGGLSWAITAPPATAPAPPGADPLRAPDADVAELDALLPPPCSQRDVQKRLSWGGSRALRALQTWRDLQKQRDDDALF